MVLEGDMSRKSLGSFGAVALLVVFAALVGYAAGVRQAFWVAADNLVGSAALAQSSSPEQLGLLESAIDANVAWLRKFDFFVTDSELDPLRPVLRKIASMRERNGDPAGAEWSALRNSPEWQELRRSNLDYLQRRGRGS